MSDHEMLPPRALDRLTGAEPLGDVTVAEFWRWALGDLRMNTARGYLGEFLVARALQDVSPIRIEWGPWDVTAADGTLVEVKTTGRLQSWALRKLSTPSWSFKSVTASRVWSETAGDYVVIDPSTRVHVWVFALQTQEDPDRYDALDIDQWTFRVMAHRELLATGQTSARVSFFDTHGIAPVPYAELFAAVADARRRNDDLGGTPT